MSAHKPVKEDKNVKSEVKVAVLISFVVILVLGLLWGDHRSKARLEQPDQTIGTIGQGVTVSRLGDDTLPNRFRNDPNTPANVPPVAPPQLNLAGGAPPVLGGQGAPPLTAGDVVEAPSLVIVPEPAPVPTPPGISRSDDALHPVQRSETFRSIATKHYGNDKLAAALQQYNIKMAPANGKLREGVTIRIPRREELAAFANAGQINTPEPTTPTIPATATGTKTSTPSTGTAGDPAEPRIYTVKAGDTPMGISRQAFGTTKRWKDIMKLNPGLREDNLKIGMKIKLPSKPITDATPRN